MRTKLFALVVTSALVLAAGVATAGARGAHTKKV
jgi:hypothetical protein